MAKLAQTSIKYVVRAKFFAKGVVEKPDIIGALFGQTEGLLGPELDLRELQRTGKIGRIDVVNIKVDKGKTTGEIIIPSSLGSTESALIAAAIETIERIGPCDAEIKVEALEDLRTIKRKYVTERAKELLSQLLSQVPDLNVLTEEILQAVRAGEITEYRGLPAGPDVATSEEVIFVEGRADVINLLKHGVKNAIAIGGTSISDEVVNLSKEKIVTVFLDGDRGGDLILKELQDMGAEIDYVARAPPGKEVEELTKKEVFKALRDRLPVNKKEVEISSPKEEKKEQPKQQSNKQEKQQQKQKASKQQKEELPEEVKELVNKQLEEILGSRAAAIFDENLQLLGRVPVKELANALKQIEKAYVVVTDGEVTSALLKVAESKGVKVIASTKKIPIKSRKIILIQG
ncbi:MAG: DNA primase [Candidatus Nanohaloarchaeota archaeon]|nr:DNA primase [Candidatus Nanohaloarchaeota archaeon]